MNRVKRRILIVAVIAAVIALTAVGSIAFFTAEERTHNVITTGGVEIAVNEWADDDKTEPFPEAGVDGVLPGSAVTKIVEVENTGSSEAWVRVSVEKAIELAEGKEGEADTSLLALDIDTENWTEKDGWYYYNSALAAGETTEPLFTTVSFAESMDNLYGSSTITVDIFAQGVQTANNGSSVLEATGWPE